MRQRVSVFMWGLSPVVVDSARLAAIQAASTPFSKGWIKADRTLVFLFGCLGLSVLDLNVLGFDF